MIRLDALMLERIKNMGEYGHSYHMDGWGTTWMWAMPVAAIVVVLLVIFTAMKMMSGTNQSPSVDPLKNARSILADRYAKGEITSEEYNERLTFLERKK